MDFRPETLRARFTELTGERVKIDAKLDPAWAELNELVAGNTALSVKQARAREEKLRTSIRSLQDRLAPIETERAAIARALGGKTGEPE